MSIHQKYMRMAFPSRRLFLKRKYRNRKFLFGFSLKNPGSRESAIHLMTVVQSACPVGKKLTFTVCGPRTPQSWESTQIAKLCDLRFRPVHGMNALETTGPKWLYGGADFSN